MAKLKDIKDKKRKKTGITRNRRFLGAKDMAIIKNDEAAKNSQIKRGVIKDMPNNNICVCSCGAAGCAKHIGFNNDKTERVTAPVNMYS